MILGCSQITQKTPPLRNLCLKAMDEGAPKKPFPSEPLIALQYEIAVRNGMRNGT